MGLGLRKEDGATLRVGVLSGRDDDLEQFCNSEIDTLVEDTVSEFSCSSNIIAAWSKL